MYTLSPASCGCVCASKACQLSVRRQRRAAALCRASAGGAASASGGGAGDERDAASTIPDALPVAGSDTDWRAFRAQLVASAAAAATAGSKAEPAAAASLAPAAAGQPWAHSLRAPEQGCLLLSNPLMFQTSQSYFHMAVILIFTHGPDGAAGLILNRPTEYTVGEMGQGAANLQPEFSPCRLYLGGDVGGDSVNLLHGICGLRDSLEVVSGVHLGGFLEAKRGLEEGRFSADQFKVLTRYCGWGPGQLEMECARGVWMPVSASKAAILAQPPPTRGSKASVADLWHHIAQLAGGDLAELSKQVRGVADPEIARAAGGIVVDYPPAQQQQQQDGEGGACGSDGGGWQPPPQRRRSKLPETDYRDGAGI